MSNSYIVVVIYRPGSKEVCTMFHKEFGLLLEYLTSFQNPVLITGDINIHIERQSDSHTIQLQSTLSSFGLVQHVHQPTHKMGGTIDIIVTRSADVVSQVNTFETGRSDHLLLQFNIN